MNQYESEGPADRPVLGSQLIYLLIQLLLTSSPLCSKKFPFSRLSQERRCCLLTQWCTNRAQCILAPDCFLFFFFFPAVDVLLLESTHFKWHFNCITPLCKYQYKAVETLTWLKCFFFFCFAFFIVSRLMPHFFMFLSWGSLLNKAALFTWIMRPQWVLQRNILLASLLDKSHWQSSYMFSTRGITRIDPLVWLAQQKVGKGLILPWHPAYGRDTDKSSASCSPSLVFKSEKWSIDHGM